MKTNLVSENMNANLRPKLARSFLAICTEMSQLRSRQRQRELAHFSHDSRIYVGAGQVSVR